MDMAWWDSPFERRSIQPGMWVVDESGTRLGRLFNIGQTHLEVRPERFRRHGAFAVALDRVVGLTAKEVRVRGVGDEVREPLEPGGLGRTQVLTHTLPVVAGPTRHGA